MDVNRTVAGLAVGGSLVAGLIGGAVLTAGGAAVAQTPSPSASTGAGQTPAATRCDGTHFFLAGGVLDDLVAKRTITAAQAKAVTDGLAAYHEANPPSPPTSPPQAGETPPILRAGGPLETVLSGLVDRGTITQAQSKAITHAVAASLKDLPWPPLGRWGHPGPWSPGIGANGAKGGAGAAPATVA